MKTEAFEELFDIPQELLPKHLEPYFCRYQIPGTEKEERILEKIDVERLMSLADKDYRPILAKDYPLLLTEAKKRFSDKYIAYDGNILVGKAKLPGPSLGERQKEAGEEIRAAAGYHLHDQLRCYHFEWGELRAPHEKTRYEEFESFDIMPLTSLLLHGYELADALIFSELMTENKRKYSGRYIIYKSLILCCLKLEQDEDLDHPPKEKKKNLAAVELGRLGGLKGGKARATKISKEKRSAIAKKAVQERWNKAKSKEK